MKISSSAIDLKADYRLEQRQTVNERLRAWVDGSGREAQNQSPAVDSLALSGEALAKLQSETALAQLQEWSAPAKPQADSASATAPAAEGAGVLSYELTEKEKKIIRLLEEFLSQLTGKKVKIQIADKLTLLNPGSGAPGLSPQTNQGSGNINGQERAGWGIDYHYEASYQEKETMIFSAQGKILTEDGQAIDFRLNLALSREYSSYERVDIKAGDALIDPLVINYGGGSTSLSGHEIEFDLDGDGTKEKISFLAQGSGFLALDKNQDGVINDGRELFGPASGNGFGELAAYDEDQNNWIDENDSIYKELRIWVKDAAGNDRLLALSQVGVGAIYLGSVESIFSLKDTDNNLMAQIQKTGIFLKDTGEVGTIQHVDFAV